MTCKCYEEVSAKLEDHIRGQLPPGSVDLELKLNGYVFGLNDNGLSHRAANEVKYSFMAPKKAGGMKRVAKTTFMRASFCPFCGVSYTATEQQG